MIDFASFIFATCIGLTQSAVNPEKDAERLRENRIYQTYLQKRTSIAENDAKAQAELAAWCRERNMPNEAKAHALVAVSLNPLEASLQKALGRKDRGSGLWLDDEEHREALAELRAAEKANRLWRSKLLKVEPSVAKNQLSGLSELLKDFRDPLAIPVLEHAGCAWGESPQTLIVAAIGNLGHAEATASLMRHALYAEFPAVRQFAAYQLARRNPVFYVPRLAASLRKPDDPELFLPSLSAEAAGGHHALVWFVAAGDQAAVTAMGGTGDLAKAAVEVQQARGGSPFRKLITGNDRNQRILTALETATGQRFGPDPDTWTRWLAKLTDSYLPDSANAPPPTVVTTSFGQSASLTFVPTGVDCFAKGTRVQTRRGPVPIEELRVGDLVLSRNIEDKLDAYQPVIRRIVRPATGQVRVKVAGETIDATLGHPFRVADRRWVYARDLKAGDRLVTRAGIVAVESVERLAPAEAFSIELAKFNTYFVGEKQILVHDNSPVYDLELTASEEKP